MKKIFKITMFIALIMATSCENLTDLDINQNPNAVAPENAEVEFLYNQVQLSFASFFQGTWGYTSSVSRMRAMGAFFYREANSETTFNGTWSNAYSNLFTDVDALEKVITGDAFLVELNSARIMKAYTMTTLVDLFGNVPLEEAGKGIEVISPNQQDGASIYVEAEGLLDLAIEGLEASTGSPANDLYYQGSATKWITLAKTLKLRIYNNTRLIDSSAGSKMAALIAEGDLIDEAEEDFQFSYSSNRANPDSRHPFYQSDYETNDGGYMNNYYMWLLVKDGEKAIEDPRTRFYFYRQQSFFSEANININDWDCVVTNNPFDPIPPGGLNHITSVDPNLPYCIASANGYFGRDHGNGQGIPPDGPLRVEYGVYPGGGMYDNNSFTFTQTSGTLGAKGEGIAPIWSSAFTDFIRAEAALTANTGEDPRALLESAVRASIAKVISFSSLIPASDLEFVIASDPVTGEDILAETLLPTAETIDEYMAVVLDLYDNSSDKLDVVMKEYYIALWGNGIEAYNLYRRTGKPNNMQPLIDPQAAATASFPRLFLYPGNYVNLNANATQRNTDEQVFWDNNPAGFLR